MGLEQIRKLKEQAKLPREKKKYVIPKKSAKKLKQEAEEKKLLKESIEIAKETIYMIHSKGQEQWFEDRMKESIPVCMNCGMEANWLLQPEYKKIWRACQAHILPKRKTQFPSVATHPMNHMVLFPVWGGHLCGDHGLYDSSWHNASKMKIWPIVIDRVWELYPLLTEKEKRLLPEIILKAIECRGNQK